ncbi:hypothetical protein L596_002306 [Steinernema carpocapsae]|uniref:Uncharacterized protein n=1 Tax=Steinernema carpocapsae TaxID=34508 RepID=A0A4U8UQR5_STECR|nr:hypothetical protein L596_002306 [Steinernema carpocapsae]
MFLAAEVRVSHDFYLIVFSSKKVSSFRGEYGNRPNKHVLRRLGSSEKIRATVERAYAPSCYSPERTLASRFSVGKK